MSKKPSSKHVPKGLSILYEDRDIIVVNKSDGLLSISTDREKEKTAHFLLNNYVKKGNSKSKNRVYIVHRLDRETSGILIFAKTEKAKRFLQDQWHTFDKIYFALVHGKLKKKEGVISSYLTENAAHRVYSVDDAAKGKHAETAYRMIKESRLFSLLEIKLLTGRKNQIRVHLSENGNPIAGDKKYGKPDKGLNRMALHAASMTIFHPFSRKEISFEAQLPAYFKTLLGK